MTTPQHSDDGELYRLVLTHENLLHIFTNLPCEILHESRIDIRFRRFLKFFCGLSQENLDFSIQHTRHIHTTQPLILTATTSHPLYSAKGQGAVPILTNPVHLVQNVLKSEKRRLAVIHYDFLLFTLCCFRRRFECALSTHLRFNLFSGL